MQLPLTRSVSLSSLSSIYPQPPCSMVSFSSWPLDTLKRVSPHKMGYFSSSSLPTTVLFLFSRQTISPLPVLLPLELYPPITCFEASENHCLDGVSFTDKRNGAFNRYLVLHLSLPMNPFHRVQACQPTFQPPLYILFLPKSASRTPSHSRLLPCLDYVRCVVQLPG